MREQGAVWGQDFPPWLFVTPSWGSLATLVAAHQPQQAAVFCLQQKHTVAPLGNATDRPANSNTETL